MSKHPGFASVQNSIAKNEGVGKKAAGAILASASRNASKGAKKANPRLKKVLGKMHTGGTIPQDGIYEMEKGENVTAAKTGSQFNHNEKELPMPKQPPYGTREKFDGTGDPKPEPKGGDCRCLSPDGIIKRDGNKRFGF
jgi:hypothetical protein